MRNIICDCGGRVELNVDIPSNHDGDTHAGVCHRCGEIWQLSKLHLVEADQVKEIEESYNENS